MKIRSENSRHRVAKAQDRWQYRGMTETLSYAYLDSPLGRILVAGDSRGLHTVRLPMRGRVAEPKPGWVEDAEAVRPALDQ